MSNDQNSAGQAPRNDFLAEHFWKLLAIAALGVVYYLGDLAIKNRTNHRDMGMNLLVTNGGLTVPNNVRDMIDKQETPATVQFKNQSTPATGYVTGTTPHFILLGTVYKDESKIETALIPWENVLCVKMHLKEPKK